MYHTVVAMQPFDENQQPHAVQSGSRHISRIPRQDDLLGRFHDEEDDIHLFDTPMQLPPTLDPNHEFANKVAELTAHTLERFLVEAWQGQRRESRLRRWSRESARVKPYQRKGMNSEQMTDEVNRDAIFLGPDVPLNRHIACPFYIRDPDQHAKCLTRANLREIKDVKQHLWNAHRLPPYCPICGEIFSTTVSSDNHIRRRSCTPRGVPCPEGINLQQMQQLARRVEDWVPEHLQWLSIWAIVFPGADLPDPTYPLSAIESAVCSFRDYWSSHGEHIVSDFLEEKGLRDYESKDEERSLAALHATVLDQVVDHLVEKFKHEDGCAMSEMTGLS
ncbi:hypothetical protein F4776DRAFT_625812 [Hypoxylon sp. NC0597]|nr:hypothetical protein F4776DRAFT_625812 [Hypoxylon sp. NC0597]